MELMTDIEVQNIPTNLLSGIPDDGWRMKSADAISYMEARYPLSEEGRDAVGLARDLHRRLLDSNASDFPP